MRMYLSSAASATAVTETASVATVSGLSVSRKWEIVEAINRYLGVRNISANVMATQLGISGATLSNMRAGGEKWESIKDGMWTKVWAVVARYAPRKWKVVETATLATIEKTCNHARQHGVAKIVMGASGCGKSQSLEIVANRIRKNGGYVVMLECIEGDTRAGFLKAILTEMGIKFNGTAGEMLRKIAETFNKQDKPLLILDEAGVLTPKKMNSLKDLINLTKGGLGITISGVDYVYSSLVKGHERQREGYPELLSRITYPSQLTKATRAESDAICEANGLEGSKEVLKYLYVKSKGDLRALRAMVEIVLEHLDSDITVEKLDSILL